MTAIAFCNHVRFMTEAGVETVPNYRYQNFFINETNTVANITYDFLPFGITTGAGKRGGDRANASLVVAHNSIVLNVFTEAAFNSWLLEVRTWTVNLSDFSNDTDVSTELWVVNSYELDIDRITLRLTSPLDAVRSDAPRRVLNTSLVGSLPSSGSLVVG